MKSRLIHGNCSFFKGFDQGNVVFQGDLGAGDQGSGKECVGTPTVLAQDTLNGKEELCAVSLDMTAVGKAGSRLW